MVHQENEDAEVVAVNFVLRVDGGGGVAVVVDDEDVVLDEVVSWRQNVVAAVVVDDAAFAVAEYILLVFVSVLPSFHIASCVEISVFDIHGSCKVRTYCIWYHVRLGKRRCVEKFGNCHNTRKLLGSK
jgi:hypothetical protein